MNSRGYQSVRMERNVIILLILISVFKSDLGFSCGEWFQIDGCHLLGAAIINIQTSLSENEPGGCLQWCGTKTVALQNSSCFCINDTQNLIRTREDSCFQNCSGKEEIFKCGGNNSDIVSLYTGRSDIIAELGPSNSSRCLTYSHTDGELVDRLVPDTCSEKHPFYCYSETKYSHQKCYRHADINDKRTWYAALERCRSQYVEFLWPAHNIICRDVFIQEERFWVAIYQWTKVLPTSTTSSTATTTSTSSTFSTTLPATTKIKSTTFKSTTISPTSTIYGTSTTTIERQTPTSTTSSSSTDVISTTISQNTSTTVLTSSSSISTSTSTSTSTKATTTTRLPTVSNLGFSSGDWFEIVGCHLLGAAIINIQTNLSENEPGGCLQWCGTKTVALQNCSGKEEIFKCGGNSSDIVSLYRERSDIIAELGPGNSSRCLTYSHTAGELVDRLVPDTCNEKHPFYCYSETRYSSIECYRHADINDKRTWYGALEACRSQYPLFLWPAHDLSCIGKYIKEGRFWVAVYQWTKVLPTSTSSSTATTITSSISTSTSTSTSTKATTTTRLSTASMASIISRPVIRPDIQRLTNNKNRLIFYCDFDPSSDTLMLYQATWYRDKIDQETKLMSSLNYSMEDIRSLSYLSETKITLGTTIICTISVTQRNITVPSEPYFIGFEVMFNDTLRIKDLAETWVHIRLTVPFACHIQSEECFLGVNMFYTETGADDCLLPAAAALTSCGIRISSLKWNESYAIRIVPMHGQNLISISRTYNIVLRTDVTFDHDFFRNYTLPRDIQVEVSTDTSNLNGKECHAICDPHMQTFDGRYYENQNKGTYILYKHLKSPVQIQMRTNRCYGFPEGPPFCPCGVAIAAGRDVFVVDRCSIPITIYMPQCDDGTLKGKIKNAGNFYQVHLPSGSWVKITSGMFFNIYIYPSIPDRMTTSGLCGYLDGNVENDFMLRNRTTVPDYKFEEFNSNWLVKPEEDLFNISNYKSLKSWPGEDYLCICRQYQDGNGFQSEKCSPDSRKFCPESGLNDSLATNCSRTFSAKPNAEIKLDPSDFNVSQSENVTSMEFQAKTNFTENSATHECWSYLNKSLLFAKCSNIPDIDPTSFVNTCVKDALITKTMFWAPTHMDNAQKRCIYQVTVNQPLPDEMKAKYNVTSNSDEHTSNKTTNGIGIQTVVSLQELMDLACPMNCNNQGNCSKGQCHCNKGYGSDDCSVDLTKPPDVYGIPNRGVCDLHESSCQDISVLGNNFADSTNIFCRLSLFQVKVNKTVFHDNSSSHHQGKWISFAEVSCPIVDFRSKRSVQFPDDLDTLAIGYRVAVGNTRDIFGRDISLLVVDSLCVDCIKAGFDITCTLKEGFYLINRRCNKNMSADKKEESGSTVLIISSVLGSVVVVIVVCGLLYYCLVFRRAQKETEIRDRAYAYLQEMERRNEYYGTAEEVYDEITDSPDDYSTIHNSVPTGNESKDSETNYVKIGNTQKNASEGYSCVNKLRNDYLEPEGRKYFRKEPGTFTREANGRSQTRPLPTVYNK